MFIQNLMDVHTKLNGSITIEGAINAMGENMKSAE